MQEGFPNQADIIKEKFDRLDYTKNVKNLFKEKNPHQKQN